MPAPRFHSFFRLFFCFLGLVAAIAFMVIMLSAGLGIAAQLSGRSTAFPLEEFLQTYALPLTLLLYPAALLWISYCRTQLDRRSFVSLGLRGSRFFSNLARGMVAGAFALTFLTAVLWLTGAISVAGWNPDTFDWWSNGHGERVLLQLAFFGIAFFAVAFFEEVLFRGYILHNLNARFGWKTAVGLQAALFALVHLVNVVGGTREEKLAALGALPGIFLIAVFFALAYRKTGSLWFPIGFHAAWNFLLGPVFSLPVSGTQTFRLLDVEASSNALLSGGPFGAEGSLLLLPILAALIWAVSREANHPQATLDLGLLTDFAAPEPQMEPETEEIEEESRENRFKTNFRSGTTFDAGTLRELRDIQDKRRLQAQERARADAIATQEAERVSVFESHAEVEAGAGTEVEKAGNSLSQPGKDNSSPEKAILARNSLSRADNSIAAPGNRVAEPGDRVAGAGNEVSAPEMESEPKSEPPVPKKPASPRW